MSKFLKVLIFNFFIIMTPILIFPGTTGKIAGKITDKRTGKALIGANVEILNTRLGASTDIDGEFLIINVRPGKYDLRVSYLGYGTQIIKEVRVIVDQTTNIELELEETVAEGEEIVITAERPMIQKDITSTVKIIDNKKIETLPVETFAQVLEIQAGVVGSGSELHFRGGRSNEVAYMIDGMYVEDPLLGGMGTDINNDAIKEMSLLSGTFNAEYGDALSGVVNIVTREGSNKFVGSLEMKSSEFGISPYDNYNENRINGYISGPIIMDKLNYFISAENDKTGSWLPWGYNKRKTVFGKLSWRHKTNLKVTLSARNTDRRRQNYSHAWRYIPDQYYRTKSKSTQFIGNLTHTLSDKMFYTVNFSYFTQTYYRGVEKDTSDYIKSSERQYLSQYGNGFEFYSKADPLEIQDSETTTLDFKSDLTFIANKRNEIKAGFEAKTHNLKYFNIYDPKRDFPYINDYNKKPVEAAAYIQDKIEYPFLILNLGLRFDYANSKSSFRSDPLNPVANTNAKAKMQLSPRLGISHPVSEHTKLHFAYGHFFQNPEYQYFYENKQYDLNVREPLFGHPDLNAEKTVAYEVGISHQFSQNLATHVTAYYKDVTGLIGTHYYMPYFEGRYVGYTLYINEDYANMKGFEINLDYRKGNISGGFNYTYSIAKGSASSETEQYPGTQESTHLYYLDFDKTHVFNGDLSYTLSKNEGPQIFNTYPFENTDWNLIFKAGSGYPYTPGGRDVGFVVKNSARMPATYTVDLKIGKTFRYFNTNMRFFLEILNLTNHKNVLYVYADTGLPDYTTLGNYSMEYIKDPSNYGPPRRIRFGLNLRY